MRILHIIETLNLGGAERNLVDLAIRAPSTAGLSIDVCTIGRPGAFADALRRSGIRLVSLNRSRYNALAVTRELLTLIHQHRYHVVHTHLFTASYYGALLRRLAPRPVYVYTEHSLTTRRRRVQAFRRLDRWVYSSYDGIIANSPLSKRCLSSWAASADAITVIQNGVPIPPFFKRSYVASRTPRLVFVGRLVPAKGADIAIDAVRILHSLGHPASLTIVGDGPELPRLQSLAAGLPVRFLGYVERPFRHVIAHDIQLVPSRVESLGLSAIEAMVLGMPVIASNAGMLPRLVLNNVTGLLFASENSMALAKSILTLVARPELRRSLGLRAMRAARRKWSLDRYIRDLSHYYERLLSERRVAR